MISVKFEREQKDGLLFSAVYVAGDRLEFHNDIAWKLLERGREYDIHWRTLGPTGSSLVISKTAGGAADKIVNSVIRDEDQGRVSDFTLFTV
ncbi:hypothetical protein [Phenylobacterium sp.]|uniref:hypothetical protein n=1 Tax=Phenylobacterium sp. TaxID=1871053 RepID=UPI0027227779|nr:hypothetical protein [Phenylobacterium sp.]MDO8801194.1 hypothetical protein [Phenylobacterium sp.]